MDYGDFKVETIHCVGGVWVPYHTDAVELMVYSTNKFNLSLVYGIGERNERHASHILDAVKYIVKNFPNLSNTFTLSEFIKYSSKDV